MSTQSQAPDGAPPLEKPLLESLRHAAEGLLFRSETDAPLEPFFWPYENPVPLTAANFARIAQLPTGAAPAPVKKLRLETFLRPATQEADWHNAAEKAEVQRFKALLQTIKSALPGAAAFRVGEAKADVYIVGKVPGGYAGLKTQVVET